MEIRLENISKIFIDKEKRETRAVDSFTAKIGDGKLVGLLGPSGCGKSTTLFMIAGLHNPTEGRIYFGDEDITDLAPEKRGIGLVFQNYALYPHMTVRENIMFPLVNLKVQKEEAAYRAQEIADLVGIGNLMDRKPTQLSGGQQQRVAIARALVKKPRVLLLDEPLSNLDARLRLQMREEIKRIQKETGITTVFVTHDQEEAMSICDEIILMELGIEQQRGIPQNIYDDPNNLFVAKFLGTPAINLYDATVQNKKVYVGKEEVLSATKVKKTKNVWSEIKDKHPIVNENNSELTLRVSGSSCLVEPTKAMLEKFSSIAGNFKFEFLPDGSNSAYEYTQGIKRNKKKLASHLGISTRELKEEERGVRRYIKKYLLDAPILITNKENGIKNIDSISLTQILENKIKTWNELGSTLEKNEINFYITNENSGTAYNFFSKLGFKKRKGNHKIIRLNSHQEVINKVKEDLNGIGVISFSKANNEVKVLSFNSVIPSKETIISHQYYFSKQGIILGRTIAKTKEDMLAMAFLDYIKTSEGIEELEKTSAIVQPKEYLLGVRPEAYTIDSKEGKITVNVQYYESVGRDLSLVCKHQNNLEKTYRIILPDVKDIAKINLESGTKFVLNSKKVYLFDKETGERIM